MSLNARADLFFKGDRVVCAVSGGADSMALLLWLLSVRDELGITLSAAHFNHCLRGREADRDEAFVRDFCRTQGITLHSGSGDVAKYAEENSLSTEEAARILRYDFLNSLPCDKIAVAHTADDNAETVLLHLLRGSGLRGLSGIAPQRGRIVRPFLGLRHEELKDYLTKNGVSWVEDSTNESPAYTRNRVRHDLLPLLRRENPAFFDTLGAHCEILRQEDELLDRYAREVVDDAREGEKYRCAVLSAAPDALQKRALRLIFRDFLPQDLSMVHVAAVQKLLTTERPSSQISLPRGLCARRSYEFLEISADPAPGSFRPFSLKISESVDCAELKLKFSTVITKNLQNFRNFSFQIAVKYDMIAGHDILVRPRAVGDKLTLSHTKTLKKWCIEKKIPLHDRDRLPVVTCDGRVVAVLGLGADRRFLPREGDTCLVICAEPS